MQIVNLKWLLFLYWLSDIFFFKINRVQVIDGIDKLCKFHGNPTKNVDFIA